MGESIEKAVSRSVRIAELESTLAARDAEIAGLKALVEYNSSLIKAWRALVMSVNRHLEEEFEMNDKSQSEIERLNALVEKRERQLVWAARHDLMAYKSRILWLDGSDADFQHGLDWDGTDAGLLAAIDEAEAEKT